MMNRQTLALATVFALLVPDGASAQVWLKDRAATEGAGVKAGNLEVHPGVGTELGYDSNWFLRTSSTDQLALNGAGNGLPVVGIPVLRITPSLSVGSLSGDRMGGASGEPQKVTFRLAGSATYREYLSSDWSAQRNLGGNLALDVQIAPKQPFGAILGAGLLRTVNPTASGDPNLMFARNDALANGELVYSPGGGTLEFRAGYRGRFTSFDNNESLGQLEHTATVRSRWLFRPRNALFIDVAYGSMAYNKNTSDTRDLAPLRVKVGTSGLLTPRIGVLLAAGYGDAGLKSAAGDLASNFAGIIAQGEVRYFFDAAALPDAGNADSASSNAVAVGFLRDFQPSMLGSVFTMNRGYARATYLWQGKVYASFEGGASSIDFNTLQFTRGTSAGQQRVGAFSNFRPDFTLFGEYRISSALGLNATLKYTSNSSDAKLLQDKTSGSYVDLNWSRLEAFAGVRYAL
jgi:hypothetical protein